MRYISTQQKGPPPHKEC